VIDQAIERLCAWDPKSRRRAAVHLLIWSFVLGHANIGAFFAGIVPPDVMDAITNYLSWLALTITAFDVVIGTDVRVQQDEG
jgi:hypothetical protein